MARRMFKRGPSNEQSLWPVILLLLVAAVVPTACVLWFMTEAMRNERLAVRQKLTAVYQSQLVALEQRLHGYWEEKQVALASVDTDAPAPEIFANLIEAGLADSVIVYDAAGRVTYPASANVQAAGEVAESTEWSQARRLEFESADHVAAASAYAGIAGETLDVNLAARALQAQARCLVKAGQTEAAIRVLTESLTQDRYQNVSDSQGRLIALNAELLALELIGDARDSNFRRVADSLKSRLSDYRDPALPADQRRFLMKQVRSLMPGNAEFPTLEAEDLAARYIESDPPPPQGSSLRRSGLPDVWQLRPPNGRVLALFSERSIVGDMRSLIAAQALPADVTVEVLPPGAEPSLPPALVSLSLGKYLDGWRLTLHVDDRSLFDAAADKQIAAYLWTGVLVIVVIVIVAGVIAGAIRRQMRLTRLKNDLVATVSHELKTPLSSMRLLVDTLLDDERFDERKVHEYLQLIAKENARLSRLIDNFLTFSRMQRNRRAFNMAEIEAAEIANTAVEAVGEKFNAAQCRLDVEVASGLPRIVADTDAIVTVIMNLLDNAYKYSEDDKRITLRTYANGAYVCFEVQDNGIGLSRRAAKKVFERFYQADQRLSRAGGGCGLGLSIVKFIVTAHGGSVSVASEPGRGSTFTVRIPIAVPESARIVGASV
ncbi:MAG: HAMP domain-containing histidine kinase [Planctomycetes bacterium]|nr:HAMP domain-containing histidine kinase [Planctomycetota bacterium]